jgi:hypothetical protein
MECPEAFLWLSYGVGLIDDEPDERRQIRAGCAHALEIGKCAVETKAPCIFDNDIDKPAHRDNGGVQLLTQERCERTFETVRRWNVADFRVSHAVRRLSL